MDNLDRIDDSLKKKDYVRTLIIIVIIAVLTIWFSFKEEISGRSKDKVVYDTRLDSINVAHKRDIDKLNSFWEAKYSAQVDARLREKDEQIRKAEEKDKEYKNNANQFLKSSQAVRYKAERNNEKSKVLEKLTPRQ